MQRQSKMVIYTSEDGQTRVDVRMENDTVWLTQAQMADLFQKDRTVIGRHINNVFREGELNREEVCAKFTHTTRHGAMEFKTQVKEVVLYNLDVIISVGYRVKSQRGVQFRKWANGILKEYLMKGYVINKEIKIERYNELKDVVRLMSRAISLQEKATETEYSGLFNVITDYVYALDTLDRYDYQTLAIESTTEEGPFRATYDNAMAAIHALKAKFGGSQWFANEKDDSFRSSIGQIYQTFAGEDLYPSVEEKAAMLLYLVVKNHSFSDGNKRIAAMLFLWFMEKNGILYAEDDGKRIADNTLVAMLDAYQGSVVRFAATDELPCGVQAIPAYGHTPGHTVYRVDDMLIVGDIMHGLALQMNHPEFCARFDMDREKAIGARKYIMEMVKKEGWKMYGMHFPTTEAVVME